MQNTGFFSQDRGYFEVVGTPSITFLEALPEGTVEVPLKPGANFEWVDGAWVEGNAPPPPTAEQIRAAMPAVTRLQFAIALARFGVISGAEAKAFGPGNALPAVAVAAIQNSPLSEADKLEAEIKALSAETIRRTNPLIAMMQAATGLTDAQADDLFTTAAGID